MVVEEPSFRDRIKSYFQWSSRLDCRNAECRLQYFKVNFTGLAWTGVGTNFTAKNGTVNFGGVAQTLAASVFNNLIFSNTGLKH
jgi:hypothetical protein